MFNLSHLTLGDIDVIKAIKEYVKEEGSVNVRQICKTTRISRPTFIAMLKALALCDIIETKSMGVNGTYVRIKNKTFFQGF